MKDKISFNLFRAFFVGGIAVLLIVGLALIVLTLDQAITHPGPDHPADALATSQDSCVVCHRSSTPGIVEQYAKSTMAAANVTCRDCHEVKSDAPDSIAHQDTYVLSSPTPKHCERCHTREVAQFNQSRHALPSYVAYAGSTGLSPAMDALYKSIPEGTYIPSKARNQIHDLEGPDITRFACETCHNVGLPHADGSVGQCESCHLRHTFSLEQARKPETCNACHIGPDHPQWEIYQESPHGVAYMTGGDDWNWEADPGTLDPADLPAATCATCHISGFGKTETSHDVGERLTWYLFAPISTRRPEWDSNRDRMQGVCLSCHNYNFVVGFYGDADKATLAVNDWVSESNTIMLPLQQKGLLTDEPFDQPIDFTYFELWHHWGRTAKFGAWMQGPDYTQWHGAYEILSDLAELRERARELDPQP
jgi:hypothetical protein